MSNLKNILHGIGIPLSALVSLIFGMMILSFPLGAYTIFNSDIGDDLSFYAPNTLLKQDGPKILFGWIPGFKKKQGWHGAISLPRELSIDSKGRLIQKPVTELEILRGELKSYSNIHIGKNPEKIRVSHLYSNGSRCLELESSDSSFRNIIFMEADIRSSILM